MDSRRRGFTLIELLIVVTVLGLLAAIAIPRFATVKSRATVATMQTALKNLGEAEETYFSDHGAYTTELDSLNFKPTGLLALTVVEASATGWSAKITHPTAVPHTCAFFLGTAVPLDPATTQGALACK